MSTRIDIMGDKRLARSLNKLSGRGMARTLETAARAIGENVKDYLSRYPYSLPSQRSASFEFVSTRQRKWFFAALAQGLQVPYRRKKSGGLAGGWHVKTIHKGAVVGQRKDYGIWVQDDDFQTPMHQASGWKTDKDAVKHIEDKGIATKIMKEKLNDEFKRAGIGGLF